MDILNSREWAILIWALLAVGYYSRNAEKLGLAKPFKDLLKTFFSRHIMSAIVLMSMYVGLDIYILYTVGIWDWGQFKNTVIWYFTVATFSLFRLNHYHDAPHRLRDLVLDNFRLIGVIEYLVGKYTFHFAVELLLVPLVFVLTFAVTIAETNSGLKKVHALLNTLLSAIAMCVLAATAYLMISDIGTVASGSGIQDFIVPSLLSTLYVPFIAFMVLYSTYQRVFIRLRSSIKKRHLEFYAKLIALLVFNFRTTLLDRWATNVAKRHVNGVGDIHQSVRQIFRMVASEQSPPIVDQSDGWSPYHAKDFLVSEGINTGHYHPLDPEDESEWFCGSDLIEFGEGLFPNNIAYYLSGNQQEVKSMKLKLNVNEPDHEAEAKERLLSASDTLVRKATGLDFRGIFEKTIRQGSDETIEGSGFKVTVTKTTWPNHELGGYDLGVELSASNKIKKTKGPGADTWPFRS